MRICCIIKPPAVRRVRAILNAFERNRLLVLEAQWLRLTPELLNELYDHMSSTARSAIIRRYGGETAIAVLLSAPSVDRVLTIVGRESNPAMCETNSLRYRFGQHEAAQWIGSDWWWENAIHRPVNERERRRDLNLLFPGESDQ